MAGTKYYMADKFIIDGGSSSHFLKADGSIDTSSYGISDFSGSYNDLTDTPTIPSGNAIIDWTADQGSTNINAANYSNTQLSDAQVGAMGYIKDYTVTSGDVTSHEGDLSIAASQVTGLSTAVITGGTDNVIPRFNAAGNNIENGSIIDDGSTITFGSGITGIEYLGATVVMESQNLTMVSDTTDTDVFNIGTDAKIWKGVSFNSKVINYKDGSDADFVQVVPATGIINASGGFVKDGGTSSQFLKADGSVDSNTYVSGSALSNYVNTTVTQTVGGTKTFSSNLGVGSLSPTSGISSTRILKVSSTGNSEVNVDHTDGGSSSDIGLYSWSRNGDHLAHIKATHEGNTTSSFMSFHTQTSGGSFTNAASNERMRITSGGSVGINTSSPRSKFDVAGGDNNGISITAQVGSNTWKDMGLLTYVSQAQADALTDGNYIFTTNPSSATDPGFDKYGGLVIQTRDDGNSKFSVRTGNGLGHETRMEINSGGTATFFKTVKFEGTFGNLDTTNDLGMQFEIGTASQNTLRTDADNFRIYFGGTGAVGQVYNVSQTGQHDWDGSGGTNRMRLTTAGDLHVDGDVIAYSTTVSDISMKENVETIENATETVKALRGVSYDWSKGSRKGKSEIGLIAQEVEQVLPDLVHEKEMMNGDVIKTVDYCKIIGLLIESNKQLSERIDNLEK